MLCGGETETTALLAGMDLERFIQGGVDEEDPVPAERWKRHRKDPSCVVGEHKHCPLDNDGTPPPPLPLSLFGDVETVSLLS